MQLTETHRHYWRRNLVLTTIILIVWFFATYVLAWYAVPLSNIKFFGWPLSFYMAAQGSLIIYVALIGIYAWKMRQLDIEHGVDEGEEA